MALQYPKTTKHIIKYQQFKQIAKPLNMFRNYAKNQSMLDTVKPYFVVGDLEFKKKFCAQRSNSTMNKSVREFKNLEETQPQTFCNKTLPYEDTTNTTNFQAELQKTRQQRTLIRFELNKKRDIRIERNLKRRLSSTGTKELSNTITFQKQQIQSHPNPQLLDLVNDNIPQYWQHSLRDNEKRLKKHIRGNPYKKQVAEEMLQTIKGRQTLVSSIPKIKQEYFKLICSKTKPKATHRKGFSLLGKKVNSFIEETGRKINNRTTSQISPLRFQQVHKLHYDSLHRWQCPQF